MTKKGKAAIGFGLSLFVSSLSVSLSRYLNTPDEQESYVTALQILSKFIFFASFVVTVYRLFVLASATIKEMKDD